MASVRANVGPLAVGRDGDAQDLWEAGSVVDTLLQLLGTGVDFAHGHVTGLPVVAIIGDVGVAVVDRDAGRSGEVGGSAVLTGAQRPVRVQGAELDVVGRVLVDVRLGR